MPRAARPIAQRDRPTLEEFLERLATAMERLEGEMRSVLESLDRLQDDFAWSLNNDPRRRDSWLPAAPIMHLTSMPRDPLAPDFGRRINKVEPKVMAALREQAKTRQDEDPARSPAWANSSDICFSESTQFSTTIPRTERKLPMMPKNNSQTTSPDIR